MDPRHVRGDLWTECSAVRPKRMRTKLLIYISILCLVVVEEEGEGDFMTLTCINRDKRIKKLQGLLNKAAFQKKRQFEFSYKNIVAYFVLCVIFQ